MNDSRYGASKRLDVAMERRDKVMLYSLIALGTVAVTVSGFAIWVIWFA